MILVTGSPWAWADFVEGSGRRMGWLDGRLSFPYRMYLKASFDPNLPIYLASIEFFSLTDEFSSKVCGLIRDHFLAN